MKPLLDLIKRFEGCKLTPYICPAGVLTVGWGATGAGVNLGEVWTQEQADRRLESDAMNAVKQTLALCPGLAGNRLYAVADFTFNLGSGRLKASTLRKRINADQWELVPTELRKWVMGGGRKLQGLVKRREAEIALI